MIRSFKHKGLETFFKTGSKAGIQPSHARKLAGLLLKLNSASSVDYPGLPLEVVMGGIVRMHNPPHPVEILREDVLPSLGLTVSEAAKQLGVTRAALSRVLNGHAAISPMMALRLEAWLGADTGGLAEGWLAEQAAYDLWQARKAGLPTKVTPLKRLAA